VGERGAHTGEQAGRQTGQGVCVCPVPMRRCAVCMCRHGLGVCHPPRDVHHREVPPRPRLRRVLVSHSLTHSVTAPQAHAFLTLPFLRDVMPCACTYQDLLQDGQPVRVGLHGWAHAVVGHPQAGRAHGRAGAHDGRQGRGHGAGGLLHGVQHRGGPHQVLGACVTASLNSQPASRPAVPLCMPCWPFSPVPDLFVSPPPHHHPPRHSGGHRAGRGAVHQPAQPQAEQRHHRERHGPW
jgi:hypothetical protein